MDWTDKEPRRGMVAEDALVGVRTFKKYVGKSGKIWMVAIQSNPADSIYVSGGEHSEGMAGRTFTFKLEDGTTEDIKGPWHTNSNALLKDTGIDIRDLHSTFGVIGMDRSYGSNGIHPVTIHDVLHLDSDWTLGTFDRIEQLAQIFANNHLKPVCYFVKSKGGSSCGYAKPEQISSQR